MCADQCKVTGHHRYQTVELNESVLGELKKLFEAKAEHVHQTLALHSYTSVLSRLQVESYVYRLLSSSSLLRSVALQQQEQGAFAVWTAPSRGQGCPAPCAAAVWESCGGICVRGVFLLCYKKLLIWCGDQWNLVFTGECPVFLALSLGSKSLLQEWLLLPELEMTLITVQKHRVDRTPKFPIFCCPRQYLISSFPNSKISWIYFLLYFFLEGHLKS